MSESTSVELPYFDQILEELKRAPDSELARAMERHVHWGLFSPPVTKPTLRDAIVATEAMTEKVCAAARVKSGSRILDVGCGFGGTIAHLNEQLTGCELVGLNIDERQLARARGVAVARPGNTVRFVQGDACELPFPDASFDTVMAVECIFHFPSRRRFFSEARRVLREGGTLAISDFVIDADKIDDMAEWTEQNAALQTNFYGVRSAALCTGTYPRLARTTGLRVVADEDITAATMPTYPVLKTLLGDAGMSDGVKATSFLEELSRLGYFQYRIMSFEGKRS
jgi:SAM-dependent methyltransferase